MIIASRFINVVHDIGITWCYVTYLVSQWYIFFLKLGMNFFGGKYLRFCEYKIPVKFQNPNGPPLIFSKRKFEKPQNLPTEFRNPTTTLSRVLVKVWRKKKENTKNNGLSKFLRCSHALRSDDLSFFYRRPLSQKFTLNQPLLAVTQW